VPARLPQKAITKPELSQSEISQSHLESARQLADVGRLAEALRECEAHIREFHHSADAYCLKGVLREALAQDPEAAAAEYRKALYLDPAHHDGLMHLAALFARRGDEAGARRLRERAMKVTTGG
jgi:chemotaxis protein methyltransferase WspC